MQELAWIMLGSALGGIARFGVSSVVDHRFGETFPWGTMVVNVSGAFLIGIVAAVAASGAGEWGDASAWRFAGIGLLGSYTTVSSFSLQTLALLQAGAIRRALGNVAGSLGLCLTAAGLGLLAGTWLTGTA
jgi:fluoride exporter